MTGLEESSIAILGGTGPLGRGLSLRLAVAGFEVHLGSRDRRRAAEIAESLRANLPAGSRVHGRGNQDAASAAPLVLLTVPYEATGELLAEVGANLAGRVVVSTGVAMEFLDGIPSPIHPSAGSVAQEVAANLPESRVVGAFHTVSARSLIALGSELDEDVIVSGDEADSRAMVIGLANRIAGLRAVDGGPLAASRYSEGLTPFLLQLNRLHRAHTGVRITGLA